MSDFHERLKISCARCGAIGKPQVTFPGSASLEWRSWVTLNPPEDWEVVDEKVVCRWCALAFRELQRKFLAGI